ncbi:unnamed protein product [Chilo suppressalis]|uniref:Uncharacterized protein n=1 Tax=Chilo suppressalis TaxID=168631 RepID=A0ABN8B721_CHISP|nr:unnamed protein product [Chilo suppressalis]
MSPYGKVQNEIDFIMSTKKLIFNDVSVINAVKTGSDHREHFQQNGDKTTCNETTSILKRGTALQKTFFIMNRAEKVTLRSALFSERNSDSVARKSVRRSPERLHRQKLFFVNIPKVTYRRWKIVPALGSGEHKRTTEGHSPMFCGHKNARERKEHKKIRQCAPPEYK